MAVERRDATSSPGGMRLLVAFEDGYRAYGGAIASALRILRPRLHVEESGTDSLAQKLDRFAPQVVICSRPEGPGTDVRVAWIQIPPEPDQTAHVRVGDRRFELQNPTLEKMLELIDEAESLIRK